MVLSDAFTIGFYKISDDDKLVLIRQEDTEKYNRQKQIKMPHEAEELKRNFVIDRNEAIKELTKIKDIMISKKERNTKAYRKIVSKFKEYEDRPQADNKVTHKTEIPGHSGKPSSDPLPMFWTK